MPTWRCPSMTTTWLAIAVLATARSSAAQSTGAAITGVGTLLSGSGSSAGRGLALGVLLASPHLAAARPFGAANTSVAASPPACRAGLGSFQVNISDVFEGATCYGRRYPDLEYAFCSKDECNVQALHRHFQSHGRREGRRFSCEAAPLTAAETAKWKVHEARLRAKDEAQAARARARAGLDRVEKEDIVSAAPEPPPGPLGLADRLEKLRGSHMHEAGQRRGHPRG